MIDKKVIEAKLEELKSNKLVVEERIAGVSVTLLSSSATTQRNTENKKEQHQKKA